MPERRREPGLRLKSRLRLLFGAAVLLILLLAAARMLAAREYVIHQDQALHAYQVRELITGAIGTQRLAEMEVRSFGLTGNDASLENYYLAMNGMKAELDRLRLLVAGNPRQVAAVARLQALLGQRRAQYERIIADYRKLGAAQARADVLALVDTPDRAIREQAEQMRASETATVDQREAERDRSATAVVAMAVATAIGCLLLILLAFLAISREQRRRQESELRLLRGSRDLQAALGEARQLAGTLRRLSQLGQMLQTCRTSDEAVSVIERLLPPLLPEMSGCFALINASHNLIEPCVQWGARGADLAEVVFAPDDCWALRRSQPYPDLGEIAAPTCQHLVHAGVTAGHTLCLPLSAQGQALGMLSLVADHVLDSSTHELLLTVGDQLALAFANLRLQQSLREQSIRDPLTGLFNRRYLEASLPRELARAERRKGQLALLMLDLDHFKRYNDQHGHDAGDALLAQFGAMLNQLCRGEDIPCRYGGEEFTVVLVDIDAQHARERAEAIRAATSQLEVRHRGQRLPVASVSIGVAVYPADGGAPAELKRVADQALYRAKREGRDRVVVHEQRGWAKRPSRATSGES